MVLKGSACNDRQLCLLIGRLVNVSLTRPTMLFVGVGTREDYGIAVLAGGGPIGLGVLVG